MKKRMLLLSIAMVASLSAKVYSDEVSIYPFVAKAQSPHNILLLNHGLSSFEERLQMIERAQKTIDIEYFIYAADKSSRIFNQALIKKAKEGVKIRILLDYFMVKGDFSPFYAYELEQNGIAVKYFNTTSTLNLFSGQYRNHRKILLTDGKELITGGRNIADEYFDLHEEYNFLDRDIKVEGEIVAAVKKTFDEAFVSKLSERVPRPVMPDRYDSKYTLGETDNVAAYEQDLKNWNKKASEAHEFIYGTINKSLYESIRTKGQQELLGEYNGVCNEMGFHSEYPTIGKQNRKEGRIIKHDIFERIGNAKSSVMIDSPYFIVNGEMGDALETALSHKVKIDVLTNSLNSTDAIYVYAVFDTTATQWLNKGLGLNIFKGEKPASYEVIDEIAGKARYGVHAKTFVFDNEDVVIGTYNVDPRSANFNAEMVMTCDNNPELAAAVQKDINDRLDVSLHLDSKQAIHEAEFLQVSFSKKLLYYFVKIPAYVFRYLL